MGVAMARKTKRQCTQLEQFGKSRKVTLHEVQWINILLQYLDSDKAPCIGKLKFL